MTTQAWIIEITYKNALGHTISRKEYHSSQSVAYARIEAMASKLQVIKVSVKQEFNRGEAV